MNGARGWALAVLASLALAGPAAAQTPAPPRVARAEEIPYPANTYARGLVSFEAWVGKSGAVEKTRPLRSLPPLSAAAAKSIARWEFEPARNDGRETASVVTVAAVFCPGMPQGPGYPVQRLQHALPVADGEPAQLPVGIAAWAEAENSMGLHFGTVVLQGTVDADGMLGAVSVALAPPGGKTLVAAARAALAKWRFRAARVEGRASAGGVVAAFVFGLPGPLAPPRPR
ncbi:MAG: hypothetical protein ACRD2H_09280 [Terriglobales bacterium]